MSLHIKFFNKKIKLKKCVKRIIYNNQVGFIPGVQGKPPYQQTKEEKSYDHVNAEKEFYKI